MKFPKDDKELDEIFRKANTPEIMDFEGEYYVDMLLTNRAIPLQIWYNRPYANTQKNSFSHFAKRSEGR